VTRARRHRLLHRVAGAAAVAITLALIGACSGGTTADTAQTGPLAPVARDGEAAPDTLGVVQARGRVIVGVKFDVPYFGLRNTKTGELSGFDVELGRLLAEELFPDDPKARTTRVEFVEAITKLREPLLVDGTVDVVISTYTITEARKQLIDFAGPYYVAGQDILASRENIESGRIRGVSDLNGKKVCSVTGSTSLNNVRTAAPKADTTLTFDRYSECYSALRDGRVDAITTDDVILLGLSRADNGAYVLTGNPYRTEPYGIGVRKGDDDFRALINDFLEATQADGRWQKAFSSTLGSVGAVTPVPPAVDRY
jgi:glutamate transport system substrate-binding protein